ncbi:uncharacterized protein LOC127751255 isoform X3 [Frankliniella occidentalis]|uniref:Uncharacterized protein LOC127751255 isoform X3 n=1 Tax=Frankliniella occidentalis TaxID=133901 RepID=A0A9C6XTK1_FRAOC|nr:uncharacterized protein LOC127751255 isoform X3 [Frankliniella occidentalis]
MFQLSQESSVIYQEAVPYHDLDVPRRRFYRYVRTTSSSVTSSSSASSSPSRRPVEPLAPHNRILDDDTPARKLLALRGLHGVPGGVRHYSSSTDYYLHVSTRLVPSTRSCVSRPCRRSR